MTPTNDDAPGDMPVNPVLTKTSNTRLAEIYYSRVMNGGNIEAIASILGDDFTFTIPTHPEVFRGIAGFREEVEGLHGAFPDVHLDVHHRWVFDDLILGLWTGTGTHTGSKPLSTPAGPLPATGRAFRIEGVSWIHADGTQLRENLANEDTLRIVHDLGVKDSSKLYRAAEAALVQTAQFGGTGSVNVDETGLLNGDASLNHPLLNQPAKGDRQIRSFFSNYWQAFSNVSISITHNKRATGLNAYRWIFEADHTGDFFGMKPTGARIKHQGVTACVLNIDGGIEQMYINENLIVLIGQMESASNG